MQIKYYNRKVINIVNELVFSRVVSIKWKSNTPSKNGLQGYFFFESYQLRCKTLGLGNTISYPVGVFFSWSMGLSVLLFGGQSHRSGGQYRAGFSFYRSGRGICQWIMIMQIKYYSKKKYLVNESDFSRVAPIKWISNHSSKRWSPSIFFLKDTSPDPDVNDILGLGNNVFYSIWAVFLDYWDPVFCSIVYNMYVFFYLYYGLSVSGLIFKL